MSRKLLVTFLLVFIISFTAFNFAYAFVKLENSWKFSDVSNLKVIVKDSASDSTVYKYMIWSKYKESPIRFKSTSDKNKANIVFMGVDKYAPHKLGDENTLALTYNIKKNRKRVVFYKPWFSETDLHKAETSIHEMGHALGLAHTQDKNVKKSIMRAVGFNNKCKLYRDDIRGIKSLYKKK